MHYIAAGQDTTTDPDKEHDTVDDATSEPAKADKAIEELVATEDPANVTQTGDMEKNKETPIKKGTSYVAGTDKAKADKAIEKAAAKKKPPNKAQTGDLAEDTEAPTNKHHWQQQTKPW